MTNAEQLDALEQICLLIEREAPNRRARASFVLQSDVRQKLIPTHPNKIDKPLRDGVIFYSQGWGWRLRKNWRETLTNNKRVFS